MASILVVITHLARGFDNILFNPAVTENGEIRFLQLPYVRVFIQGRLGVVIFSMVTGYVCALKPIKLSRQGNQEGALASMSKSALRRSPRLILPTTIITCITWLLARFGAFTVANHAPSPWTSGMNPNQSFTDIGEAFADLVRNIFSTWTRARNAYDPNHWNLLPLLQGSMKVYVFIMATCYLWPRFRLIAALAMFMYYYISNDPFFGMQFFWGVFLADLQNHPTAVEFFANRPRLARVAAIVCLAIGFTFASLPERNFEWAPWSNSLKNFLSIILPKDPDYSRFSSGLGLIFISLAIHLSPLAKDVLSNRAFLWLGKQSFAVYLLHGPLLRTTLCWIVFGFNVPPDTQNDKGEVQPGRFPSPSGIKLLICISFWLPFVYAIAVAWTTYVDPWCARVTEKMVSKIKEETGEKPLLPAR